MNDKEDTKGLNEAIKILLEYAEYWQDHLVVQARDKPTGEGAEMVKRGIARAKRLAGIPG